MCRLIAADGGDVFKFAGDACIVLWPNTDDMNTRLLRAVQCAYAIQDLLSDSFMGNMEGVNMSKQKSDVQLSVKCGIGMGNVSVVATCLPSPCLFQHKYRAEGAHGGWQNNDE